MADTRRASRPRALAGDEGGSGDATIYVRITARELGLRRRRDRNAMTTEPTTQQVAPEMPLIAFGSHRVSRLIVGANPINGGSHLSRMVNLQMKRYFTPARVLSFLRQCEELGINTWQSGEVNLDAYLAYRQQGGHMQYISLWQEDPQDPGRIDRLVSAGVIGIAHHGETTDVLFKSGQVDLVREHCKQVRDAGVMVGVSTHMPAVVDHVVSAGWDVDFFMCCVYERHRTREELRALLGDVPLPLREVYLEGDPPRMFAAMRQTDKPCLAFKILAAGVVYGGLCQIGEGV
jgi:hypothetical protein